MNESVLNALMQLFALVAGIKEEKQDLDASRQIVSMYLRSHLSQELTNKYLNFYDDFVNQFSGNADGSKKRKRLSASSVKILKISEKINVTLNRSEKLVVLFRVIEYVNDNGVINDAELDLVSTLADTFTIQSEEFENILKFTLGTFEQMPIPENLIVVDSSTEKPSFVLEESKHIFDQHIDKPFYILYLKSIETFVFKYTGNQQLRLTGRNISSNRLYVFDGGSIVRGSRIQPIYQTEISNRFRFADDKAKIRLVANQVEFKFKNSDNGLHKVSFELNSGQLVGIMGGSGVGKSTFLNILIGKYPVSSGEISINGYDIQADKEKLEGLIGYVPQDDLLIEELTVYQNLFYNAKLCFGSYTDEQIDTAVVKVLKELGLYETRALKVGNPLNKFISGGQRKRLNIALELIREPSIMFVDEPTSGLSSTDSEIVMDLLKHQALTGKLIVVNIHQPSSDIYKLFDRVWILDKGGFPIYQGNPIDAIAYFKEASSYADFAEIECPVCGTVHPEEVLDIVEEKMVDEFGKYTRERRTKPVEWYTLFRVNLEKRSRIKKVEISELPKTDFKIPSKFKQFLVFVTRDILSKFTDKQYLLLNLFEPPLLALILAFFSKKITDEGDYIFSQNINMPIFFFMAVVVALFLGLSVSAEEIIKDRRILEREKFLNLSRFSYLNSKVLILFLLSAYQMFSFIIVSQFILQIKGLTFQFWLALFSTAAAANIMGLNISSAFKNVVTIYILIPLILVPQMLLGGAMIKYEDIYPPLTSQKYVPVIGDIMFSRWAYEAIIVYQFEHNEFEKHFFDIDKEKSEALYISAYFIPELKIYVQKCEKGIEDPEYVEATKRYLQILHTELEKLQQLPEMDGITFQSIDKLSYEEFNSQISEELLNYLDILKKAFNKRSNELNSQRDEAYNKLVDELGQEKVIELKKQYHNEKISDFVLDKTQLKMLILEDEEIIRKKDPIFKDTDSKFGRSHFYAAKKYLGSADISTFTFNIIILWVFAFVLYITLYFEWFRKLIDYISSFKWKNKD
ncbi:MAG: ATP-binding cassette domain-containing protein [Bacteroidales bacterium]|nr:ATP-binding cassette domain-containing protein [Bacteroidales bacterium]